MKKLLIINPGYFGSYVDTIYHAKYLQKDFNITYYGINEKDDFYRMEGVNYVLINNSKYCGFSKLNFFVSLFILFQKNKFDLALINYFIGCSVIQLFTNSTKFILDVRTSFIFNSKFKRFVFNLILTFESFFFKNITIISEGVRKYLNIKNNSHILPLGASSNLFSNKSTGEMNLLYVGTFKERKIHETIIGFHKFYLTCKSQIKINYTIIGSGSHEENNLVINLIKELELENVINYLGYINHNEIYKYFEISNIGISYIPITSFFNFQPPTKTFEYLINGLIVIGTNTFENSKVINIKNGILIDDNSESFYEALICIKNNLKYYKAQDIYDSSQIYSWENIVSHNLIKYLEQIK